MFDLLTVVFDAEIPYLEIQAKSIELYLKSDEINNIIVIVNDRIDVVEKINLDWFGPNRAKVKIYHHSHLSPDITPSFGWGAQQLCKMLGTTLSTVEWCITLDAKTFFVNTQSFKDLMTDDNRFYANLRDISHWFVKSNEFVKNTFGVDLNYKIIEPGGVPFPFHVPTINSLVEHFGRHNFVSSLQQDINNHNITEYMLYTGYVIYKYGKVTGLYCEYDDGNGPGGTIRGYMNIGDNDSHRFDELLGDIKRHFEVVATASIHRKSYALITDAQRTQWLEFLLSRNLIDSVENAKAKLNTLLV